MKSLQFPDLMKEVTDISEPDDAEITKRSMNYLQSAGMDFESLKPYLQYYPDKTYKNMYKVGLLRGLAL